MTDTMNASSMAELLVKNAGRIKDMETNIDTFFLIVMSMVIFLMQCGFAFLEAGSVRSKNTTNILLKNLLDSFIGCFIYWAVGYSFAYGEGNLFIGHSGFFGTFPQAERITWLFQFVFAATACTIVSGSVAERCDIWPYFIYSIVITGLIYPVVSRWAWHPTGWLADGKSVMEGITYQDFAGSGVVHLTGAVVALFGAIFCGPRLGRFEMGTVHTLPGHSVPLASLGAFILLFGFFAFNGGSNLSISKPGDGIKVATAMMNTIISGTGGAIANLTLTKGVGMIQEKFQRSAELKSSWSLLTTINGALVGMVAVCAGCDKLEPWAAFLTGIIASFFYFAISMTLVKLKIDDPLEAVAVHGGGGIWGVLSAPLFTHASDSSTLVGKQFGINFVGMIAIISWTSMWGLAIFGSLRLLKILRVSKVMELKGMDVEKHGEAAYPIAAWQEGWSDFFTQHKNSDLTDNGNHKKRGSSQVVKSIFRMAPPGKEDCGEVTTTIMEN